MAITKSQSNSFVQRHRQLDDILKLKLSTVNNIYRAVKEATSQRVGIVQDIMNVSLATLGGSLTLQIFASKEIKTHFLFYLAIAALISCVVFALLIRISISNVWSSTAFSLGESEENLRTAVGHMKYHDEDHHSQANDELQQAIETEPNIPDVPWLSDMRTISALGGVFIAGLLMIALSLLFHISIS